MVALLVSTETISPVSSEAIVDWKRVSSPGMGMRAYWEGRYTWLGVSSPNNVSSWSGRSAEDPATTTTSSVFTPSAASVRARPARSFGVSVEQTEPRANAPAADKDNAALIDDREGHTRVKRDSTKCPYEQDEHACHS